jgi:hypothetical protein
MPYSLRTAKKGGAGCSHGVIPPLRYCDPLSLLSREVRERWRKIIFIELNPYDIVNSSKRASMHSRRIVDD